MKSRGEGNAIMPSCLPGEMLSWNPGGGREICFNETLMGEGNVQ